MLMVGAGSAWRLRTTTVRPDPKGEAYARGSGFAGFDSSFQREYQTCTASGRNWQASRLADHRGEEAGVRGRLQGVPLGHSREDDALSFYGYQTTVCWVCWSSFGPREMGDKTKPVMPPGAELDNPECIEPPPDAVPDISATSESNLIDAWNGTGPYAQDKKLSMSATARRTISPMRSPRRWLNIASCFRCSSNRGITIPTRSPSAR
jgi:hypothetical protein